MRKRVFFKNAAILTASSLGLRFLGIFFKVWLAAKIGAEGIGLYQLIFSVYVLFSTFASSGITTAVTRLVADEAALGEKRGIIKILRRSILLILAVAAASAILLFVSANFIAEVLLSEPRAALSLRLLCLSLPLIGISSVMSGYFIARRRAAPSALSQLAEQAVRIAMVLAIFTRFGVVGERAVEAVIFADSAAHSASVAILAFFYFRDKKRISKLSGRASPPFSVMGKIIDISAPITGGRYLNSFLRTGENLLVPHTLSGGKALAQFGMIKGMALPILFFPSSLLGAFSTLLIPEISEARAKGNMRAVRRASERIIGVTAVFSIIFAAVFFTSGREIAELIYNDGDVGFLLTALSPIVPFMYLDSVCDGILKGLDQQKFCFKNSIGDSVIRILLILILLPRFGMNGFLAVMYVSNLLTSLLNVGRLVRVSGCKISFADKVFMPLGLALGVTVGLKLILGMLNLPGLVYIILMCAVSFILYFTLLFALGCIKKEEILN